MTAGRPTAYTPEKGKAVADCIAEGMTIDEAAKSSGIPKGTIYGWNYKQEEFQKLFARARDRAADAISYDAIRIADDPTIEPQHKRIMVDTRLKLLGKWSNRYGEKVAIDHTSKGERVGVSAMTDEELEAIALKDAKR